MIWRYESEGQGFESLSAHQRNRIATPNFGKQCGFFFALHRFDRYLFVTELGVLIFHQETASGRAKFLRETVFRE